MSELFDLAEVKEFSVLAEIWDVTRVDPSELQGGVDTHRG